MCLAVPAQVESLENGIARCRVGNGQTFLQASTMLLERPPRVGEYLIVHAGFALHILDAQKAEESLQLLRHMAEEFQLVEQEYNKQKMEDDDLAYPR
ncbi:HypC/HybG/HupF family hydrogenase formation chaperone [Desulfoplanes formicivorans]|uniref:Hydantoin utilization protein B n=1 Tax=Desulfoplanes formicivorans TaxID=1592317 RepID=A0A194AKK6_9BACT|nr:HypC/HybG/HupF family hydrogenase formation chaperone [Desulfoplanes formicivorans]GAU09848.1 hydantoin utilization protein B [Desulfoplanes formicivorans]